MMWRGVLNIIVSLIASITKLMKAMASRITAKVWHFTLSWEELEEQKKAFVTVDPLINKGYRLSYKCLFSFVLWVSEKKT